MQDFLILLNNLGLWDLLTLVSGLSISFFVFVTYRKRIPEVSIYSTYFIETGHELYPNTIHFEVRNLMDSPIVITRPNFRFSKHFKAGDAAHGNLCTGDFEIKFKPLGFDGTVVQGKSYTSIMLRHRECAFAYIPIDDNLNEEILLKKLEKHKLGKLSLSVVLLKESKPKVITMNLPIQKLVKLKNKPPLGIDSQPKKPQ